MNRIIPESVRYYDKEVSRLIVEKYGYSLIDAFRAFVESDTYDLLSDRENGLSAFGAAGVFDLWEAEKVTGDPRNSIYIRGE